MTPEERQRKVKWLSRYRILENQIKRLEAEKERWMSRATNTVPAPVHFKYYDSSKVLHIFSSSFLFLGIRKPTHPESRLAIVYLFSFQDASFL